MKNIVLFFALIIVCNGYSQHLTQKEITDWFIYSDLNRNDRLKNVDQINSVEIYVYSKNADTSNLSDEHLVSTETLIFDTDGKVKEKKIKIGNTLKHHTYVYDAQHRLVKTIDSIQLRSRDFTSYTIYTYKKDAIEKIHFSDEEPTSKLVFSLEDGIVNSYKDVITESKYLSLEFDLVAIQDFYDYIEGIETSEKSFKNLSDDCNSCKLKFTGDKLKYAENKYFKRQYKYKNDVLIEEKIYDKDLKSLKNTTSYKYDDKGNWITKTDLYWEKPFGYVVRKINYK